MAELADAPDLGSGIFDVQVQVLLPALRKASGNCLEAFVFGCTFWLHRQRSG
jgi:hypothetical protein